jgi:hypothetical protein
LHLRVQPPAERVIEEEAGLGMQVTSGRSLEANTTRIASSGKRVNVVYFFNFERRNDVIDLT